MTQTEEFFKKEVSPYGKWANFFLFCSKPSLSKNDFLFMVLLFLIFSYHNNLFWQTLFNSKQIYDLRLSVRDKFITSFEYFSNIMVYGGIWSMSGFSLKGLSFYCFVLFCCCLVIWVLYNYKPFKLQPFRRDMDNFENTLKTTVSLKIPKWIDFLHLIFLTM